MARLAVLLLLALCTFAPHALACGASVGGAAGVSACSLSEHEEAVRKKWRVGIAGAHTATTLRFSGGLELAQTRDVVIATIDYRISRRWTFETGLGSLLAGRLHDGSAGHDFSPGLTVVTGGSVRLVDADGARPFLLATTQAAFVAAVTHDTALAAPAPVPYQAFDLRLGVVAGWPIAESLTPYFVARAFGGPIFWRVHGESSAGTDVHHYQLGGGLSLLVAKRVDIFAEGVPLGERALAAGAGVAF